MEDPKLLLENIDKIHTTKMGKERIMRNLGLPDMDVMEYCKKRILDKNSHISRQGKNWYCETAISADKARTGTARRTM